MMRKIIILFSVMSFSLFAADVSPEYPKLLQVYKENLAGMRDKNLGKVIATFHPASPSFNNAKASAAQSMVNFDLSYKITGAQFVGITGDLAVIRVILETRRIGGSGKFKDNRLDALQVFKRDKSGKWKLWSSSIISVTPLSK